MPRSAGKAVRVLVGDRTPMDCQLLSEALQRDDDIEVCGLGFTSSSIFAEVDSRKPDILLLSESLEDGEFKGLEAVQKFRLSHPEILCVVLLDSSRRSSVVKAFQSGARGVFCRSDSAKLLAKCIHCIHGGQIWARSAELRFVLEVVRRGSATSKPVVSSENLSKREHDVVQALAQGLSNREIAKQLGLTEHTVKNYLFRIFDKLRVSTRVELVLHTLTASRSSSSAQMAGTNRALRRSARRSALFSRDTHSVQ